jgi:uncharacterized protein
MEFSNLAIDPATLPKAEEASLQGIEPAYWRVLQLQWLITSLVVLAAGAVAIYFIKKLHSGFFISLALGAWLLLAVVQYFISRRSFSRKGYAVREKDVLYRTGWIIRSLHVCPFNRIQHCSVHSGPLERRYGLASLTLFTAGSEGSDLTIPGLTEEKASALREFIMQKIRTDEQPAD